MRFFKLIDCAFNRRHYGALMDKVFILDDTRRPPFFARLAEV